MAGSVPFTPNVSGSRLAYLDWLRFFVVLSLAPFHAALSFTGMGVVYVYDGPVRDALLAGGSVHDMGPLAMRLFTVFMDNWFMHLLFLVSGVAAAASLRKRTAVRFIGERANRLLLPLLLGTLLIISIQAWLRAVSFGTFSGSLLSFYPSFFNGINTGPGSRNNFDYGHLWFLLYLFVFSMIALPLFLRLKRLGEASPLIAWVRRLTGGAGILAPLIWIALLEGVFRPGWPGFQNLVNDWANFSVYLSFFLFGYFAGLERNLLEAAERNRFSALTIGLLAFVARLAVYRLFAVHNGYNTANMGAQALRGVAAYCIVVAVMGFGRRLLNRENKALGLARDLSFPLYLLHFVPVSVAILLLLHSGLPVWARWGIAVTASWASVSLFTAVARFVPLVRDFFGIRPNTVR